jgi:hypothetical protein
VNAERLGYSEMLRLVGILNDLVEEVDSEELESTTEFTDEGLDQQGENPLPRITYHNFVEKLSSAREVLAAIKKLEYAHVSHEEAVERYIEAQHHVRDIGKLCSDLDRLLAGRIRTNKKPRRSKTRAA